MFSKTTTFRGDNVVTLDSRSTHAPQTPPLDDDDDHDDHDHDDQHDAAFRAAALDFLPRTKKKGWFFDRTLFKGDIIILPFKKRDEEDDADDEERRQNELEESSR